MNEKKLIKVVNFKLSNNNQKENATIIMSNEYTGNATMKLVMVDCETKTIEKIRSLLKNYSGCLKKLIFEIEGILDRKKCKVVIEKENKILMYSLFNNGKYTNEKVISLGREMENINSNQILEDIREEFDSNPNTVFYQEFIEKLDSLLEENEVIITKSNICRLGRFELSSESSIEEDFKEIGIIPYI